MSSSPGQEMTNAIFQYVAVALLTPENVIIALGAFVFLSAIFLALATFVFDRRRELELLAEIERNTRPPAPVSPPTDSARPAA